MELRNSQGGISCAISEILQQTQEHVRTEHYRKHAPLGSIAAHAKLWKRQYRRSKELIHPKIIQKRDNSRLYKYLPCGYGSVSEITTTTQITEDEIKTATRTLQNRKTVGNDGIASETIIRNQQRITPIILVILHHCQIAHPRPKLWLRGITTFTSNRKEGGNSLP